MKQKYQYKIYFILDFEKPTNICYSLLQIEKIISSWFKNYPTFMQLKFIKIIKK